MDMWSNGGTSIEIWAEEMASRFFLSSEVGGLDGTTPDDWIALGSDDWLPLIGQLDTMADLDEVIEVSDELLDLLEWEALPTALLEASFDYLEDLLEDHLDPTGAMEDRLDGFGLRKGRRGKDRHLLEISLAILRLGQQLPESAHGAVTAWANLQRQIRLMPIGELACETCPAAPFCDEMAESDLPPAVQGFSLLVGLSLMRWPQRAGELAHGLMLKMEPALYTELMARWQALPDDEVSGPEALFAQGRLAHFLSQVGTVKALGLDVELDEYDAATLYSRLSRAMLLIHNRCRHCEERADLACQAVVGWEEGPCPLMDIAANLVMTGSLAGCPKVEQGGGGNGG
jgi:hypothetical protein